LALAIPLKIVHLFYNFNIKRAMTEDSIAQALDRYVSDGELAGAAALVWRQGRIVGTATVGTRDLQSGRPVDRNTIFRVASMTKPVTTVAALMLLDEGRFELDEPILSLRAGARARARAAQSRRSARRNRRGRAPDDVSRSSHHRSGLTYGDFHRGPIGRAYAETLGATIDNPLAPDQWIERLAALPLIDQPGSGFHYGVSTDLLGFLIARLERAPLSAVLERRVFAPLGMRDTGFGVPRANHERRAGLCGFDSEGRLTALTAAPGRHALDERPDDMTFESGGQGLWSTLDDYLGFARMLIGDAPNGLQLLRRETLAMMTSNQLTPEQRMSARMLGRPLFAAGHGYGMGVAVVMEPDKADPLRCRGGAGTIGWPGAYGGWWQADPNDGSVLIFLAHNMAELPQMARGIGSASGARSPAFTRSRLGDALTHSTERKAARAQQRDDARRGLHGVRLRGARRLVIAVVHHDDVAGARPRSDAIDDAIRGARAKRVDIPQHPAPANQSDVDRLQPFVHRSASPSPCGRNARHGFAPAADSMRFAFAVSMCATLVEDFSASQRFPECRATAWPSANMRLMIGAVSSVTCASMRKNVARAPSRASASSSAGVVEGFGPSSYVR
jgi:CubicO group peptidase (beta-lactamase class C family)